MQSFTEDAVGLGWNLNSWNASRSSWYKPLNLWLAEHCGKQVKLHPSCLKSQPRQMETQAGGLKITTKAAVEIW